MEREIEIKVLNLDLDRMERELVRKGAKKIADAYQTTTVINSSAHPIDEGLGYLRIRNTKTQEGETTVCTFKEKRRDDGVRVYHEHTVAIDDADELFAIFRLMGYDQQDMGHKRRISYRYLDCRFDLDRWDEATYPDPYMEIEGPDRETIERAVEDLEIDPDHISTRSIAELRKLRNK